MQEREPNTYEFDVKLNFLQLRKYAKMERFTESYCSKKLFYYGKVFKKLQYVLSNFFQ